MAITDRPPEPPTSANDAQRRYLAPQQSITNAQTIRYEIEIDPANACFYVTANGLPIARFCDHRKATSFVLAAQGLIQ